MNHRYRCLPPLNLCYLQRKAYQIHLKKLKTIRGSAKNNKTINQTHNQYKGTSSPSHSLTLIRQQSHHQIQSRLSPFRKRAMRSADQQNQRLFNQIRNCPSTINHQQILKATSNQQQIRNRIRKFTTISPLDKPLLKSQLSLNQLQSRDRNRIIGFNSRHSNRIKALDLSGSKNKYSKDICQITVRPIDVGRKQKTEPADRPKRKTDTTDRFISERVSLSRNTNKIRSHFDTQDRDYEFMLKARAKVTALRKNAETYSRLMQRSPIQDRDCSFVTSQHDRYRSIQKQTD